MTAPIPLDKNESSVSGPSRAMVVSLMLSIIVPAWLTLRTVTKAPPIDVATNPTPYGYTWSLLLFIAPLLVIAFWHYRHREHHFHIRSLAWAAAVIAIAGFVLDIVLGASFLTFENVGATTGVRLPAVDIAHFAIIRGYLPIEEFGFYVLGGLFVVALYSWIDADWIHKHSKADFAARARAQTHLVQLNFMAAGILIAVWVAGVIYKSTHDGHFGIPGYFTFLTFVPLLPACLLLECVSEFINWTAFAFTCVTLLLISMLWEATLAIPYHWWGYQTPRMLGITVTAWWGLPIEAVIVWIAVTFDAIIAFEVLHVFFHMDRPARAVFFPKSRAAARATK
ncbi:MAG: hypothetical protein ABI625_12700 [bacterium]